MATVTNKETWVGACCVLFAARGQAHASPTCSYATSVLFPPRVASQPVGRLMVVVAAVVVAAAAGGAGRPSILLIMVLRPCGSNAQFWAEILCFFPGRI